MQEDLRDLVAMDEGALAAFLVVDDEADRHAGAARPFRVGRIAAIADEVARVGWLLALRHGGGLHAGEIRILSRGQRADKGRASPDRGD